MKSVERALRAELKMMPGLASSSSLAKATVGLAQALDADPGDDARTRLSRELRLATTELWRRAGMTDVASETERFLERIAAPAFRHAQD